MKPGNRSPFELRITKSLDEIFKNKYFMYPDVHDYAVGAVPQLEGVVDERLGGAVAFAQLRVRLGVARTRVDQSFAVLYTNSLS
jgi:hypothetical protein